MIWRLLIILIVMILCGEAFAHKWYTETNDPMWNTRCCGGHDCAVLDPQYVTEEEKGYRITLTGAQVQKINPNSELPVDALVPWNRVQAPPYVSEGETFHICIYDIDRTEPRGGVICFFATPTM